MNNNWEVKRLGDIASVKGGKRVPKGYKLQSEKTRHPYITVSDFNDNGTISLGYIRYINDEVFEKIKRYTISTDDLYISIAGTIGKTGIVPPELDGANLTENACKLVFNKDIDKEFIHYFTKTTDFIEQAGLNTRTAAQPKLALERLKTIKLQLPEYPEQQRIVAILDEAFSAIDKAKENAEKNLQNAREIFESHLQFIFITKGDGWVEKKLGDVCKFVGGSQPPKTAFSHEKKEGYVRLIQIRDYKSDNHMVYIPKEQSKRFCGKDDVMIGRYGPPLFQILRGLEGSYNVALIKVAPDEKLISKNFLYYFLKNRDILKYIIDASSRAAGQIGLNKATIEPYPIAFPPIDQQKIIVAQLEELQSQQQRLEVIYQQKLDSLAALKQSILQKAFAGELHTEMLAA